MRKLFKLKEWITVQDAAKYLSDFFDEDATEADILRLALDGHLSLSIYFASNKHGKRTIIRPVNVCEWLQSGFDSENVIFDAASDEDILTVEMDRIVILEGVFDVPMVFGNRLEIERRYQELIGSKAIESVGEIIVKRNESIYELQTRFAEPCFVKMDDDEGLTVDNVNRQSAIQNYFASMHFPDDSLLVVRTAALRDFEQSLTDAPAVNERPLTKLTDSTLVATIAALLASWPGGKHPSAKDLEKAADCVGVSVSDDSIRKALNLAKEIAPSLKSA